MINISVPLVVGGVLLSQNGHLKIKKVDCLESVNHSLYYKYLENHLLPDAVVCSLEVGQHLENNLLCIALVTPVLNAHLRFAFKKSFSRNIKQRNDNLSVLILSQY